MFNHLDWVTGDNSKLCPVLRQKISELYSVRKWLPRIYDQPVRALKQYLSGISVIVQLKPDHHLTTLNIDNLGGVLGCQINYRFAAIAAFAARVNLNTLQSLAANEAVQKIWLDRKIKALLDIATPVVNAPPLWRNNLDGKGVGIAILDTGIYPHPDLTSPRNRIIKFKDFLNWRSQPYDDNGHGTHCAGDAAGNGFKSAGKYRGPAPQANLIGIKVLNRKASGFMSHLLAGIQWCIDRKKKYGIKILSLSLGVQATESSKDDPLCQAVEKAWQAGLVVCVAAGNEGPDPGTIYSPGIDPRIITVGALDDKNTMTRADDAVALFSSRGPTPDGFSKPDLVAPGAKVTSLRAPSSYLDRINRSSRVGQWYMSMSGTSMSAPICSGIAALILESNPTLTPAQVKSLLLMTCRSLHTDSNSQGAGLVDARSAVKHVHLTSGKK